ncbi:HAMP domain-containing sensor histidine kinase [Flammeovirgaceae bacterium SG7u.111]|nr:HAMP domain-containing sensor histidine kinase [Flammeovirgaceae bacterium SG7u.132]WPO36408.1 HAMP domain-containing sensor histidine kinase [Flammeovirgaceae bacterium SG7u.111]
MVNIYQNKEKLKWFIVGFALLIGTFSIFYTNQLVRSLADRELGQVDLLAKGLAFLISGSGGDQEIHFVLTEIVDADNTIPLIWTDADGAPQDKRNLTIPNKIKTKEEEIAFLYEQIELLKQEYEPIVIRVDGKILGYIYYSNSYLITQLKYFSYIQLFVIGILSVLSYFVFSSARRAEQNRVWVGLSKETAHQLGTPISSLMAWVEYLKTAEGVDQSIIPELSKDIQRLEMITARFSSIGSEPTLKEEDILDTVENIVGYLQKRISTKVKFTITPRYGEELRAKINVPLFEWVIENLCKNAVDAMSGIGKIEIYLKTSKDDRYIEIDVSDTGKGIPKSKMKTVFQPGYSTKKRGWGLGLTLVKRIVDNYHNGKIYVLKSEKDAGTTFRILIPRY